MATPKGRVGFTIRAVPTPRATTVVRVSSTTAPRPQTPRPPSFHARTAAPGRRWGRRILLANLVAQVVIVVTGGAVRLTGSGLGCSTWPQCEPGEFTPVMREADSWHPIIEFGNRTLTGVLTVLALLTAWVVWRQVGRSRSLRLLGLAPLVGVAVQAVLGGVLVLLDLPPALVGLHFLVSMGLVAVSTALIVRVDEGDGPPVPRVGAVARQISWALLPLVGVVLVLGVVVTGAGPHSGDEEAAYRLALDPALAARVHAVAVWAYLAGIVALLVALHREPDTGPGVGTPVTPRPRRAAVALLVVSLAQGLIGYLQYLTGLPEVLVGAHMLGASVLVVAQVGQTLSLRTRAGLGPA